MPGGRITHVEFPADDMERAKRFYAAVAGWEFQPMEGFQDYELFQTDEETGGAIGARGTSTGSLGPDLHHDPGPRARSRRRHRERRASWSRTSRTSAARAATSWSAIPRAARSRSGRTRPSKPADLPASRSGQRRSSRAAAATISRWIWFVPS